jgi:anaerobic magnesium-protoporphyrin IX monomethyl ester cyclase
MKVLFISANRDKGFRPSLPLGMVTVAAELEGSRHEYRCIDMCFEDNPVRATEGAVNGFAPDVIGISIRNIDLQTMLEPAFTLPFVRRLVELCHRLKPETPVVLGGAGFSLLAEGIMRYTGAEYGITGPGEKGFPMLLDRIESGGPVNDIPGLLVKADDALIARATDKEFSQFGAARVPARHLYDNRYFTHRYQTPVDFEGVADVVLSKRACPGRCRYCATSVDTGLQLVLKSPSQTVDEIQQIIELGKSPRFEFGDGAFNMPFNHALAVCREMARRAIRFPWNCMFSPYPVTPELVDLMAQTGCDGVEMGAESGADVILKTLKKHFKAEHITRAYGMFKERGIKVEVCIFVGTPGETRESILESFDFLERLVPDAEGCHDRVTINFGYRIFKNTWLHRVAIGEGVVREGDDLAFPRYYVAPSVLGDDSLLDLIQDRVVSKRNWYLWWGLPRYSLKDRVREAEREIAKMQALYEQATEQCPIVPAR